MRAMVLPRFGGPELFEQRDVQTPAPAPDEVLVRVVASGTNPVDAKLRQNGSWAGLVPPVVLGYDAAGIVEECGSAVHDLRPGDEVWFTPEIHDNPRGTYAEFVTVRASIVALKPQKLSFGQAAAVPLAGGTAWEAVVRRLAIRPGETILIHGGAGGVGSFAVQFAKAAGARVIATASLDHQDFLRELGADIAVDYKNEDAARIALDATNDRGVDAAFDIQGDHIVSRCLPALRPFGRVACVLAPQGDLALVHPKNITVHGVFLTREAARLDEMRPLFERGVVRPIIDQALPLGQVRQAHERLDTGHGRGKVVLRVAG